MESQHLGAGGPLVSHIGLGCVTFGREIDEKTSLEILDYAFENGIRLLDTAEGYGGGQARAYRRSALGVDDEREVSGEMHSSEKILGRWLRTRNIRNDVVLVTKIGKNFTSTHVLEAVQASLDRLQTEYVDGYLLHNFDAATPMAEAVAAMDVVLRRKYVRAIGFSNHNAAQARSFVDTARSLQLTPPRIAQVHYNLAARECETELLPYTEQEGIGVLAYSPLAAGFLTGKYRENRNQLPPGSRFHVIPGHIDVYFSDRNFQIVRELHEFAASVGVPPLRLAMGWVLRRPHVSCVLVGARSKEHIRNSLEAMQMEFPPEWMQKLDALSA